MNLKLTRIMHRMIASYLRALAAGLSTLGIGAGTGWLKGEIVNQLGAIVLGAAAAPGLVFLTETAELVDESPPPPPAND